jgi:hypothetical protein
MEVGSANDAHWAVGQAYIYYLTIFCASGWKALPTMKDFGASHTV